MTPNQYIISKLKSFIKDFPQTRVRYEHDEVSDTHFVEVMPNEVYHMDDSYIEWEGEMFDDFVEQFPCDNICFISDDAIVGLENVDFELRGDFYYVVYTTNKNSILVNEKALQITSLTSSEGSSINEYTEMLKNVHVEKTFGFTFIQPNKTSLQVA